MPVPGLGWWVLFLGTASSTSAVGIRLDDTQGWAIEQQFGSNAVSAHGRFGASMSVAGDLLAVGAPNHEGRGAVHLHRFNGLEWAPEALIERPDDDPGGVFGRAVAVADGLVAIGDPAHGGGGAVFLYRHDGETWALEDVLRPSRGGASDRFGTALAMDDGLLVVGAPGADGEDPGTGAVQLFAFDGLFWEPFAQLHPRRGEPGDAFGSSVALDDGWLAVGSPYRADGGAEAGSCTVYHRGTSGVGGDWTWAAEVHPGDRQRGDRVGSAVALTDGVLAVGAPGDDDAGANSGALWLFALGDRVTPLRKWIPRADLGETQFGHSVSARDGVVVATSSGSVPPRGRAAIVRVFRLDVDGWFEEERLAAAPGQQTSTVPAVVSIGDGAILVGTPLDATGAKSRGSVTAFRAYSEGDWTTGAQSSMTMTGWSYGEGHGAAVEFAGSTALVGMPGDSGDARHGGAVYAHERLDGAWAVVQRVVPDPPLRNARFGACLAVDGDRLVVGAPGTGPEALGDVYLFEKSDGRWTQLLRVESPWRREGDGTGTAVDLEWPFLAVGAPRRDPVEDRRFRRGAGAVDLFMVNDEGQLVFDRETLQRLGEDVPEGDDAERDEEASPPPRAGSAATEAEAEPETEAGQQEPPSDTPLADGVAFSGRGSMTIEVGDAGVGNLIGTAVQLKLPKIYIGAPGRSRAGAVLELGREETRGESADRWTVTQELQPDSGRDGLQFGSALYVQDDRLIVGAPANAASSGEAFLFDWRDSAWQPSGRLRPTQRVGVRHFGASVAMDDGFAVVGAPSDRTLQRNAGSVHVFGMDEGRWQSHAVLYGLEASEGERFGAALALNGRTVLVGAPGALGGTGRGSTVQLHRLPQSGALVSLSGPVALPDGRIADAADVMHIERNRGHLRTFFDAGDVLLPGTQVDAVGTHPDGSLILSFEGTTRIPELRDGPAGEWVDGSDLVKFTASSWGLDTEGTFEFLFDGSDVGLESPSEDIDGVALDEVGELHLTLSGEYEAGTLKGNRECILRFQPDRWGADTMGTWAVTLECSDGDVRLGGSHERIDALHVRAQGPHLIFSTRGTFRVPGVREGGGRDLLVFHATQLGGDPAGTFRIAPPGKVDLGDCNIDALHLFD